MSRNKKSKAIQRLSRNPFSVLDGKIGLSINHAHGALSSPRGAASTEKLDTHDAQNLDWV